jgi:hypothetical protein
MKTSGGHVGPLRVDREEWAGVDGQARTGFFNLDDSWRTASSGMGSRQRLGTTIAYLGY